MMNQLDVRSRLLSLTFEAYILSDLPIIQTVNHCKFPTCFCLSWRLTVLHLNCFICIHYHKW